jgi:spermidine/putrescine transport system ATP-binding protein
MALLELRGVTRRFGDFTAVDNVSMSVEPGEFFTLLGPSGCGKTTLLRMIAGFDEPDEGTILVEDRDLRDIPPERRNLHTVFQSYALFPHMSVERNIAFPLRMAGVPADETRRRVGAALEQVQLQGLGQRYPAELSGGQRQRVAVARALINRPRLLLLDEPLAALDAKLRESMQSELIGLQREVGVTFVYVTHDQSEALALSHRIAVMNRGRVEQLGEPSAIYGFPRNRFVADFVGECNMLPTEVRSMEAGRITLQARGVGEVVATHGEHVAPGAQGVLALRPEQVRIAKSIAVDRADNHFRGTVKALLYRGEVTLYTVELEAGGRLQALLPNTASGRAARFDAGASVEVGWPPDAGHFLTD